MNVSNDLSEYLCTFWFLCHCKPSLHTLSHHLSVHTSSPSFTLLSNHLSVHTTFPPPFTLLSNHISVHTSFVEILQVCKTLMELLPRILCQSIVLNYKSLWCWLVHVWIQLFDWLERNGFEKHKGVGSDDWTHSFHRVTRVLWLLLEGKIDWI